MGKIRDYIEQQEIENLYERADELMMKISDVVDKQKIPYTFQEMLYGLLLTVQQLANFGSSEHGIEYRSTLWQAVDYFQDQLKYYDDKEED